MHHSPGHPPDGLEKAKHQLRDIKARLGAMMSAVTDFHDKIVAAMRAIEADVDHIFDALTAIQNSPGTLSPADQASLDDALATAESLKAKADKDALPPVPPTPPA